ncbi:hypothetical protein CL630_02760 [bacterium]|nr:hypothetical protein [bacterium]|tara:strand:+ start:9598 stop:10062 length:465 start_codon:yes stop_codon:yes gene_type:complete
MPQDNNITWQAPDHEHGHKNPDWFWAIGIIATSIAVVSIISGNTLFALFILLSAITLFIHAIKKPRIIQFSIQKGGISINTTLFPYDVLESFDVIEHKDRPFIIFKSKKTFTPYIIVPTEEGEQAEIKEYLLQYLPEQALEIPLSHRIAELIGL